MIDGSRLLESLPVAAYVTDSGGHVTYYNSAAAELWGHRPPVGATRWSGAWKLLHLDGEPMAPEDTATAQTLRDLRPPEPIEAVAVRPDGTRAYFLPQPSLIHDADGTVLGTVTMLIDASDSRQADLELARLAAIVSSSDDAIISKTLDGIVTSWNAGATRIFGYEAEEMIGESIRRIIPLELQGEEEEILAQLKQGKRVDHFDTVRLAKDGRRVNISVTISPLRDRDGNLVGASKVARDVTERKRSEELQQLLFGELNHRVKNTLATIQAIAGQSLLRAATPADFVASFNGRVQALARAHDVLVKGKMQGADLAGIIREQVVLGAPEVMRVTTSGPPVTLDARTAMQLGLVLHELATNARKYGALSKPSGQLSIVWTLQRSPRLQLQIDWRESGVPMVQPPSASGFGTVLIERTLSSNGGEALIDYASDGLNCHITVPLPAAGVIEAITQPEQSLRRSAALTSGEAPSLQGKRILLVEDEPLISIETETQLLELGCEVVGPAATVVSAKQLAIDGTFDAALLDANLAGQSVHEVAGVLAGRGIPFAFASGYGRDALPPGFANAPLLGKPFSERQLRAILLTLVADPRPTEAAEA